MCDRTTILCGHPLTWVGRFPNLPGDPAGRVTRKTIHRRWIRSVDPGSHGRQGAQSRPVLAKVVAWVVKRIGFPGSPRTHR